MEYNIAVDLKVARRRSGLSQLDISHLLEVDRSRISKLENGHAQTGASELAGLCLIYGKELSALCPSFTPGACKKLSKQLETLPTQSDTINSLDNRSQSLSKLAERLSASQPDAYEG